MEFRTRSSEWLREPLLQFLLIGLALYAVLANRPPDPGEQRIVVNERVVSQLVARWTQSFRRAPSQAEIDGLIRDYVKDEVYYRAALRLGLDRDDEAVRRLMRNKLVATAASEAEATRPTDAQLQGLLDRDPARYAADSQFDFTQVYLGSDTPERRAKAASVLGTLQRGGSPDGEVRLPLPRAFTQTSRTAIDSQFGDEFSAALRDLPVGEWRGPVASGLGLHLVRVERKLPGSPPKVSAIRQRLENDWRAGALAAAQERQYRELLAAYEVVTEVAQ